VRRGLCEDTSDFANSAVGVNCAFIFCSCNVSCFGGLRSCLTATAHWSVHQGLHEFVNNSSRLQITYNFSTQCKTKILKSLFCSSYLTLLLSQLPGTSKASRVSGRRLIRFSVIHEFLQPLVVSAAVFQITRRTKTARALGQQKLCRCLVLSCLPPTSET
jgi:hypothetical protein